MQKAEKADEQGRAKKTAAANKYTRNAMNSMKLPKIFEYKIKFLGDEYMC